MNDSLRDQLKQWKNEHMQTKERKSKQVKRNEKAV